MSSSSGSNAAGKSGRAPLASAPRTSPAPVRPASGTAPQKAPAARPAAGPKPGASTKGLVRPAPRPRVRRARLVVSKVDTWSVLKLAFLLSVALGIITVVASVVLWIVLDLTGLFDGINELLGMLGGTGGALDIKDFLSLGQVAIFATIVSVVNVILLTALSVLAALLYNIAAALVGGVGVTLTDD
ncbi:MULTISPECIES: DUF3566 domain-containing protein [Kocuria]|jgi:hypothetical protein|uniref:DUF3566 domain-containing protein n=1 Tax=Kocuria TaxID=57493 RepID=UPI00203E2B87|nr:MULTISPECIES: DUF3566 domain-containing protein [Kocuria]MCM3688483.1 DUF3566 domain-containing protein [Kocuria rosea]HST71656.1 DUF3566 domain-containing protein [Kocuria rosea]